MVSWYGEVAVLEYCFQVVFDGGIRFLHVLGLFPEGVDVGICGFVASRAFACEETLVVLLGELVQCVPGLDVFHVVFVVECVSLSCVVVAFSDLAPESNANVVFVDAAVAFAS